MRRFGTGAALLTLALAIASWSGAFDLWTRAQVSSEDGKPGIVDNALRYKPVPIRRVPAVIPDAIRLVGRDAIVTAKVTIRADGTVAAVEIVISDIPQANDIVVEACREWLFEASGIEQETMYHTRVGAREGT